MTVYITQEQIEKYAKALQGEQYSDFIPPPRRLYKEPTKKTYEILSDPEHWVQHSTRTFCHRTAKWRYCLLGAIMIKHSVYSSDTDNPKFHTDCKRVAEAICRTYVGQTHWRPDGYSNQQIITSWNDMCHREHKEVLEVLMDADV